MNALGYAHINVEQAWEVFAQAMAATPRSPFEAMVLEVLAAADKSNFLLEKYYLDILSQHQYWYENCDPLGEGLPHHPEGEPGTLDITFLTALTWSNESLIKLGHQLGADVLEVIQWHELTIFSMNERLWNEAQGNYQSHDSAKTNAFATPFLPMAGEIPTQDQAEDMLLQLESALFRQNVSVLEIWLLHRGMLRYDFEDIAAKLRRRILHCCEEYGFCEGFNLETGKPLTSPRQQSPLAAALILDLLKG